ncbi:MAG: RNA polymerase factor sigma-54 [bacterium]
MRHDLRIEQRQKLVMTPKLQQAIKLLQVTSLELQQMLKQELMVNPLLEEAEEPDEEVAEEQVERESDDEGELKAGEEQIDWDRYLKDGFEMGQRSSGEHEEREDREFQDRVPVAGRTLAEHLAEQLRMATDSEADRTIGEFIIGSLDADGFLSLSAKEISDLLSTDEADVARVVALVKTFDPPGVAAHDLAECLLIQLEQLGAADSLAATLVREHLEDLRQRRYPEIARKTRKTVKEIQAAAEAVAKLDPRPGARFTIDEPRYIVPDLIVEKVEDRYVVQLNDRNVPRLRINRAYRDILRGSKDRNPEEYNYVVDKLNSAKWLIKTIDQRRRTMIRVMEAILEVQHDFFEKGIEHLKPLTLQQIAEMVQMHESTVSRVTNNKYVQTPRGVFELKYFFSTGLRTDDGDVASSKQIKERIRTLIGDEDKSKPLSDQEIGEILKREGFNVARRTVAKYRDQLEIFHARMRKQY